MNPAASERLLRMAAEIEQGALMAEKAGTHPGGILTAAGSAVARQAIAAARDDAEFLRSIAAYLRPGWRP